MHKTRRANTVTATIAALAAIVAGSIDTQAQPSAEMQSQARALAQVCRGDYTRLCSTVQPGGGRVLACLQQHLAELSAECRGVIPRAEALRSKAAQTGALPR